MDSLEGDCSCPYRTWYCYPRCLQSWMHSASDGGSLDEHGRELRNSDGRQLQMGRHACKDCKFPLPSHLDSLELSESDHELSHRTSRMAKEPPPAGTPSQPGPNPTSKASPSLLMPSSLQQSPSKSASPSSVTSSRKTLASQELWVSARS